MSKSDQIKVVNARTHNLKNISVTIPKNKITVITGLSGSGKTTLAFDTIYADSQRRYIESLSSYARQFLQTMDKPDVDEIHGLIPSIAIDQKTASHNPRSTVGTVTETYDYLRLLFARVGIPHCPECDRPLESRTKYEIAEDIMLQNEADDKLMILAPVVENQKGQFLNLFTNLKSKGYTRVRINGDLYTLDEPIALQPKDQHNIDVVIDRLVVPQEADKSWQKRVTDALEQAIILGQGDIFINNASQEKEVKYSTSNTCPTCHLTFPKLEPALFSFNSHRGACSVCQGLGYIEKVDIDKLYDPELSLFQGALNSVIPSISTSWFKKVLSELARHEKFSLQTPMKKLPKKVIEYLFFGLPEDHQLNERFNYNGITNDILRKFRNSDSRFIKKHLGKYIYNEECQRCQGSGLNRFARNVLIGKYTILELTNMSIDELRGSLNKTKFTGSYAVIAEQVLKKLNTRLRFLSQVGLGYLTLSRRAHTLSGGEAQRVRLASQLGTGLTGILYVLDEPSIGLHMRDVNRLIKTMEELRDQGNTLIIVEHDGEIIRHADHVIEIGPKQGLKGGKVVFSGSYSDFIKCDKCITPPYITEKPKLELATKGDKKREESLTLAGATHHNLKGIDIEIPFGELTVVTGVSGSGKSSLIFDTLFPALHNHLQDSSLPTGHYEKINNLEIVTQVINVDQSPIGTTPRSIPATYVNIMGDIRQLFASTLEAKARGYKVSHFSFNTPQGQCPKCRGTGYISVEMLFMPDLEIMCDICQGTRYKKEILDIDFNEKTIADILSMSIDEATVFFQDHSSILRRLKLMQKVGLGYLQLGQSSTTLSGGESQRIKLTKELAKRSQDGTVYLLDEPSIGLHDWDIAKLMKILKRLTNNQATVVVVEHNPAIIREADWVIDLGPEGGQAGGNVIYQGSLSGLLKHEGSLTGKHLKELVAN